MPAQHPAIDEQPRPDPRSDGKKDRVAAAARGAAPTLAEDVGGTVAVDRNGDLRSEARAELFAQRVVVPTGDVRRPRGTLLRAPNARNGDADRVDPLVPESRQEVPRSLDEQRADVSATASDERPRIAIEQLALRV